MKRYNSYKDSGVEWIGEIPSHWRKSKTNFLSSNYDGKRVPLNGTQRSEMKGEIPYWGSNGVVDYINKSMFNEELVLVGEDGSPFFDIYKPISFKVTGDVWINNHIHVLKHKESEVLPDFLVHSFNITDFKEFITGSTRDKLTQSDLSRIPHFLPPLPEQQQIVSFLDTKTSLIDSLIEKTQRKIELLKEKRTSLINEVVTKGLNPNVEMKDIEVEWIGEIPSHWETKKLKYLSEIIYGISPPDTTYNDEGVGTLLINGPVEYSKTDFGYTRSLKWTTEPNKFTSKGSLLFCLRGSTTGRMNITHTDVSIGRGVCSINSNENQWFLIYSMFSVRRWIQDQISGSTFPSVTSDDVNNYVICSPPINEQQQIVEYLDEQTQLIDNTISIEEKRIELLKEYRQSLISEVVTGKRKVV